MRTRFKSITPRSKEKQALSNFSS